MDEALHLTSPVQVTDNLDACLCSLERGIASSLQSQLKHAETTDLCATQMLSLAASIQFTHKVENAMRTGELPRLKDALHARLLNFSNQKKWRDSALGRMRGSVRVMDDIHHIDTLEHLIESQVRAHDDWEWNKTLRFYEKVSRFWILQYATLHVRRLAFLWKWRTACLIIPGSFLGRCTSWCTRL